MRKIKVIRGGCGITYTDKNGVRRHALKTPESGEFKCEDSQAKRFVEMRIAVYVDAQGSSNPGGKEASGKRRNDLEDEEQPPQLNAAEPE